MSASERDAVSYPELSSEQPFRGLESYTEDDRDYFFGRTLQRTELLRRVQRRGVLTELYGHSGLGKTSLLNAGLFPLLREHDMFPISVRLDFSEEAGPLVNRVKARIAAEIADPRHAVEAPPPDDEETLWEYFHRARFWGGSNVLQTPVLVLDQFEELFTLGRNEPRVDPFVTELADLIENRVPVQLRARMAEERLEYSTRASHYEVILALRESFLPDLEELKRRIPSIGGNRMRLKKMDGVQAKDAVLGPGKAVLTEEQSYEIIAYATGDDRPRNAEGRSDEVLRSLEVEPFLLNFVCERLNKRRVAKSRKRIDTAPLQGTRARILEEFYEESLRDLGPEARDFVEDVLINEAGNRELKVEEDAKATHVLSTETIEKLIDRRLVRREKRRGIDHVELIHDVLCPVVYRARADRRERLELQKRKDGLDRQAQRLKVWTAVASVVVVVIIALAVAAGVLMSRNLASEGVIQGHEAIIRSGGLTTPIEEGVFEVEFDADGESPDQALSGIEAIGEVAKLDLSDTRVTSAGLENLSELESLKELYLSGAEVGDEDLVHIRDLAELIVLELDRTVITDAGLNYLESLPLRRLDLSGNRLSAEALETLRERLGDGVEVIHEADPFLEALVASDGDWERAFTEVDGADRDGTTVRFLDVAITDGTLAHLSDLEGWQRLELRGTAITPRGLRRLHDAETLVELHLEGIPRFGAVSVESLEHLGSLRSLELYDLELGDEDLEPLQELPNLRSLALVGLAHLTGEGLESLAELDGLSSLTLGVSPDLVEDLAIVGGLPALVSVDLEVGPHFKGIEGLRALSQGAEILSACCQDLLVNVDETDIDVDGDPRAGVIREVGGDAWLRVSVADAGLYRISASGSGGMDPFFTLFESDAAEAINGSYGLSSRIIVELEAGDYLLQIINSGSGPLPFEAQAALLRVGKTLSSEGPLEVGAEGRPGWFRFDVPPGGNRLYRIAVTAEGDVQPRLSLYDGYHQWIATAESLGSASSATLQRLLYSGTYFIEVESSRVGNETFQLVAGLVNPPVLELGSPSHHDMAAGESQAWFRFDVPDAGPYEVSVSTDDLPGPRLAVYETGGMSEQLSWDYRSESPLQFDLVPGSYYLSVESDSAAGGEFEASVSELEIAIPELAIGVATDLLIRGVRSSDMRLEIGEAGVYEIVALGEEGVDPVLNLYSGGATGGELIGSNDDSSLGTDSRIFAALLPGEYTVRVSDYNGTVGVVEVEASRPLASPLMLGTTREGVSNVVAGGSWFALTIDDRNLYRIAASGGGSLAVSISDQSSGSLGGDSFATPELVTLLDVGVYYVLVEDLGFVGGPFEIEASRADPLTLEADVQTDIDFGPFASLWYAILVEDAGQYRISAEVIDYSGDPVIELYQARDGGALIASDDDGGGGLNSLLDLYLEPGRYLMQVWNLSDLGEALRLSVVRVPEQ